MFQYGLSNEYNCCSQQPEICSKSKICKSFHSIEKPWKRFTCECPDGYRGDDCDQPIRSCQGYASGTLDKKSGKYKVLDASGTLYDVYCHFDSYGAWTLVLSYSFANSTLPSFSTSLSQDVPISQSSPTWRGYRLSNARMKSIKNSSDHLRFTCEYEKHHNVEESDYFEVALRLLNFEVVSTNGATIYFSSHRGKVRQSVLDSCQSQLHQASDQPLHVHIKGNGNGCNLIPVRSSPCHSYSTLNYFGNLHPNDCFDTKHHCVQSQDSSTQLWFGHKN